MPMNYKCQNCGKEHTVYFRVKSEMSQTLKNISDKDKERVAELETNYSLVDKSIAVFPVTIEIKTEHDTPFCYETWVECDAKEFSLKL